MTANSVTGEPLKPLKISCTSANCAEGLHCFLQTRKMKEKNEGGRCRSCGADLVDWKRVQKRDLEDANFTFTSLKVELIRHHFWHIEIDQKAINHARRKGKIGMQSAAEKRIRRSIGAAEPTFDGRQTPKSGNTLYYAQHATASCCRKCVEEWHGIPRGRELTDQEINYLTNLIVLYINERMPFLTETGEKIPPLRRVQQEGSENKEDQ